MRVKKPQSKRKSTRLQQGIKKKVAAHHRKQNKLSKKDVTWKSKSKKDPGIPNSFPYKAQILEKIEENRIKEAEEKERRREAQRASARAAGEPEPIFADADEEMNEGSSNGDRLAALVASAEAAAKIYNGEVSDDDEDMELDDSEDDEEEVEEAFGEDIVESHEGSRKAFDKIFKQVVDSSDVILYVLDARNPEGTRSRQVEHTVLANPSKRLLFVLNKIDLVPSEVLKKWVKHLELFFPVIPLAASSPAPNATSFEHKGMTQVTTATALLQALKKYASTSQLKRSVTVGVIGYPNVGKSSVINSLTSRHGANKKACPVGAQAGVTTNIRKVKVDNKLSILDSPGIVFPSTENSKKKVLSPVEEKARLILLNAVPPKQIDDARPAVSLLLKRLQKNTEQLERLKVYYDLPPLVSTPHDAFVTAFLVEVARKRGRLGRGGIPDMASAAMTVITDWRDGRVAGWALPPVLKANSSSESSSKTAAAPVEEKTMIVAEWAQEFSLDGLWDGAFDEE